MKIDDVLISKLEKLSRIRIPQEERENLKEELSNMIAMVDKLKEVDTRNVKPLTHIHKYENVERQDKILNELTSEEGLLNAPKEKDGHFAVPKVL